MNKYVRYTVIGHIPSNRKNSHKKYDPRTLCGILHDIKFYLRIDFSY